MKLILILMMALTTPVVADQAESIALRVQEVYEEEDHYPSS